MRLSVTRAAFIAAFAILVISGRALAEGSAADASPQPKDWITLDTSVAVTPAGEYHRAWSPSDQEPVLLPLPAEGWAGIAMLTGVITYCGVRRARLLAPR